MKFLVLILALIPTFAHADMAGVNFGFGQGSASESYGVDYEIQRGLPYIDIGVSHSTGVWNPSVSAGAQWSIINVGVALSQSFVSGGTNQFAAGPELGLMANLTSLFYVKENSQMLFDLRNSPHTHSFGTSVAVGVNL